MQPTVKPKQADDPHDVLEVAPGVALVAPSNAADPTDEEVSNLLRTAARRRSGAKASNKPAVAASSSAPPVDTTFRPAAGNNVRFRSGRSSMGKRIRGGIIGVVLALSVGVGVVAWQSYGDATTRMVATWGPQLGLATSVSPRDSGLAAQQGPAGGQAAEVTSAPEQSSQSAPQAVTAASSPAEATTLQSVARDVATLEQKVEQLQATVEQLKASLDQTSRDLGRGSDAKGSDQNLRPRTSLPASRQVVVPARRPTPVFRQPQATAAPVSAPFPAPYGQRQPEPLPPPAQQLADPELSSIPRPPMPLHQ
jgi:hypothetical protein